MKAFSQPTSAGPSYVGRDFSRATVAYSKLRRLARMPLSEIAGRGRQEAAKLLDRATTSDRPIDVDAILRDHAPAYRDPAAALQIVRDVAPSRFFAGVENLRASADAVRHQDDASFGSVAATLQHRFDLLGYRTLWFGDPIDWHFDPVWARRAPRVHWTQLDPLDPAMVGDSKVVWELNRHQWVARLAHRYAVSGDERYAESALAAIESWID